MFELPNNSKPQVRPEVVNRLVAAMFTKGHLNYCDTHVSMDGKPGFTGYHDYHDPKDTRKFKEFTMDERKAAFDEFRKKGYHIAKEEWYGARCQTLWCYIVKETKDTPEDRQFHYIF